MAVNKLPTKLRWVFHCDGRQNDSTRMRYAEGRQAVDAGVTRMSSPDCGGLHGTGLRVGEGVHEARSANEGHLEWPASLFDKHPKACVAMAYLVAGAADARGFARGRSRIYGSLGRCGRLGARR